MFPGRRLLHSCITAPCVSMGWLLVMFKNCKSYTSSVLEKTTISLPSLLFMAIDTHLSGCNSNCHLSAHGSMWSQLAFIIEVWSPHSMQGKLPQYSMMPEPSGSQPQSFVQANHGSYLVQVIGGGQYRHMRELETSSCPDLSPLTTPCWVLLLKNAAIHFSIFPLIP